MQDECKCKETKFCYICGEDVCVDLTRHPYKIHKKEHDKECRRTRSSRTTLQKKSDVTEEDIKEYDKRKLKPRKKKDKEEKEKKEEKKSSGEEAKNISRKRKRESTGSSTSSSEKCQKLNIFGDWKKHEPQAPEKETKKQIAVLKKLAVKREGCTCFVGEEEKLEALCYDDLTEAKKVILKEVELLDAQKSQQCSAFSILMKDGKYLILKTNSTHSGGKDTIEKEKGIIRPAIEPQKKDFPFMLGPIKPVIYNFNSCDMCSKVDVSDSLVFDVKDTEDEKKEFKELFIEKLEEKKITAFTPKGRDNQVSLANSIKPFVAKRRKSRTVFALKIQPNKTAAEEQTQQGWSLHHSEMECFVFARRHGWEIVVIYIDRDCCPVCASTLNNVDKEDEEKEEKIDENVHKKISSFYALKKELNPDKEKKMEIDEEKKTGEL